MTNSDLIFAGEIALLLTNIHCPFVCGATILPSPSFFFCLGVELSSYELVSCSISTNAVVLCAVSKCFLKLEVVLQALNNGFMLAGHNVHCARKLLLPSSTTPK